jgi:hypothetical protein
MGRWSTVMVFGTALLACASPIRTDHDQSPDADFSRYATYAWVSEAPLSGAAAGPGSETYVSRVDEATIRRAVDAELAARGYRMAPPNEADLMVGFEVGTQKKVVQQQVPGRVTVYSGSYRYGDWYRSAPVRTETYTEGTLSIEFFGRVSKQAVWVGWASKRLTSVDDPEALIQDAVASILKPFPVHR